MMLKLFFYIGFVKLLLYSFPGSYLFLRNHENKPPEVVITKPAANTGISWNAIVPYSIYVNDPEDGNSEYDEILGQEVLLMVNYVPNTADAEKLLTLDKYTIPEPLVLMSKSTCLICHASKATLIGPSFDRIARRYSGDAEVIDVLTEKVISGSTGTWGELIMPPHPDVEIKQLKTMISWMLEHGANPDQTFYTGIEGAFRTREKTADEAGAYVLTAGYTDHGKLDWLDSARKGSHTAVFIPD